MISKAIVVTGSARGMGAAHAVAASALGAHIYVVDVLDGTAVAEKIRADGGSADSVLLDVTNEQGWLALAEKIESDSRAITGLVNNAAVSFRHRIEDTPVSDFRRVVDTNLTSAYIGIRTFAPSMAKQGGGSIVNISSIAGVTGYFSPAYTASKWGLIGLTKTAAGEWGNRGVRVNAVAPGTVATPLLEGSGILTQATFDAIVAGRPARPEEISAVVRFLLSDDSTYVNGADWVVDGGLTSNGLYQQILARAGGHLDDAARAPRTV